jgi:hypothetical protein
MQGFETIKQLDNGTNVSDIDTKFHYRLAFPLPTLKKVHIKYLRVQQRTSEKYYTPYMKLRNKMQHFYGVVSLA